MFALQRDAGARLLRTRRLHAAVLLRWHSSYDFVEECNRWHAHLAMNQDECNQTLYYATQPEWNDYIERVQKSQPADYAWIQQQHDDDDIIRVPSSSNYYLKFKNDFDTSTLRPLTTNMDAVCGLVRNQRSDSDCFAFEPLKTPLPPNDVEECLLSYLLGMYSFDRYKTNKTSTPGAKLHFSVSEEDGALRSETYSFTRATYLVQDLISTPAMDLTPGELQRVMETLVKADQDCLSMESIVGKDLLDYNGSLPTNHGCGMIYHVGKATNDDDDRQPRLLHVKYKPRATDGIPKLALVGKGVTYDTGGLNLKSNNMVTMKKDMAGAAHVLGLLMALVEQDFAVEMDAWIPVVENVVDGNSYRPGDVLTSVLGTTTEIGNTDAEGRVILGDALALASATQPDLIVDFASLTGAARVAMGTDIVPYFCNTTKHNERLQQAAIESHDVLWELPLWEGYQPRLSSKIADLRNVPNDNGLGGSIMAALYLQEFIGSKDDGNPIPWIHLDIYGMEGTTGIGKAQGLRGMYRFLQSKFGSPTSSSDEE